MLALVLLGLVPGHGAARGGHNEGAAHATNEEESREYEIKAAFLLNFLRYTTWPAECFPDESAPVVLTIVGRDPFGSILERTFEGEKVYGRRVNIQRSREVPEVLAGHALFCAELPEPARAQLLAAARKRPLLLVGDSPGMAEGGACINLYLENKKTRFEVNTDAVAEARLVISPAMLNLAKIVRTRKVDQR